MALPHITRAIWLSYSQVSLLRSGRVAVHSTAGGGFVDARGSHDLAVTTVERILRYSFRQKGLLAEALTHPSHPARPSYDDRLRGIGHFALSTSLSQHHRRHNPDRALSLLAKEMSSARLAIMAVNHDLYRYLRRNDPDLDRSVADFASLVEKLDEGLKIEDVLPASGGVVFPRVLEHVVMSVAGAVHLDCGSDLEVFLKKIGSFWEPLVA